MSLNTGDKVRVPNRFNRLVVREVREGRVIADFVSGHGHYEGPTAEFALGWADWSARSADPSCSLPHDDGRSL